MSEIMKYLIDVAEINECLSLPCMNGAKCVNLLNGYQCQCLIGWQGPICDVGKCLVQ